MTIVPEPFAPPHAAAFDALYRAEFARVARIARRILADDAEAEDVAQEVFAALARRPEALGTDARAWLHASAVRGALNAARSRRRRTRDAALLAMRYGGDLSYREIADALAVPPEHVGPLLARARAAFAREVHRAPRAIVSSGSAATRRCRTPCATSCEAWTTRSSRCRRDRGLARRFDVGRVGAGRCAVRRQRLRCARPHRHDRRIASLTRFMRSTVPRVLALTS